MNGSKNKVEARQLLLLGVPSIIAQLAQAGLGVIDTMMAGHYNAQTLAAIALGNNLFFPAIVIVIGLMLTLNPTIAQLNGQEDWGQMRKTFHNGIYLGLFIAVPFFFLLRNLSPLLNMAGIDPVLIAVADDYLGALAWGMPGLALFFAMRFTNEGLFANKVIMKIALSALPLNMLTNYWFMYGGMGLEGMGAVGVGWATTTVYYYMFLALFLYTIASRRYYHIRFIEDWRRPEWQRIKDMLTLGIPMALSIGLEVTLFGVIGVLIGAYGVTSMAAHQIALNISSLTYMMPLGLSMAITARVGYHIGKGNRLMSRNAGYIGISMAFVIMIVNATILVGFPATLSSLYSENKAVVNLAAQLLFFAALFQISDGVQAASIGALRGMKDTKVPVYITAFAYWVIGFPAGYYLAEIAGWGITGYWTSMVGSLSFAAVMLTLRFIRLQRARIAQQSVTI